MVFAIICDSELSDLIIMRRDMDAAKYAKSYIDASQMALPHVWQPGRISQQDGAKIHTAKKTIKFFEDYGIDLIRDWPPYSPDLNPIEHFWGLLQKRLL